MGKGNDPNCAAGLPMAAETLDASPLYSQERTPSGLVIPIYGARDEKAVRQIVACMSHPDAVGAALMGDHHAGYSQPIGGVAAYRNFISVSGVGYDIGCGVRAVRTNLKADDVPVAQVMDEIARRISFGLGRPNNEPVDHEVFDKIKQAEFAPLRGMLDKAAQQLGTVGSGNHYVDLLVEEGGEHDGSLWIATHFGSRGFGHTTANGFLAMAAEDQRRRETGAPGAGPISAAFHSKAKEGEMDSPPVLLDTRQDLGQAYVASMNLALDYAYAGRELVVNKVLEILGAEAVQAVENHHNAAWRENVGGEDAWVVRKGATPAGPGQTGFVGGSMGDISVVVEGLDGPRSAEALFSTVHGAGRVMSRTKAAGKWAKVWTCRKCNKPLGSAAGGASAGTCSDHPDAEPKRIRVRDGNGEINWDAVQRDLAQRKIEVRGGGADEAPGVYKNLETVLSAHDGQIAVRARMRPIGVAMAGADTFDPFKD